MEETLTDGLECCGSEDLYSRLQDVVVVVVVVEEEEEEEEEGGAYSPGGLFSLWLVREAYMILT